MATVGDPRDLPFILQGKYFEILEEDGQNITAKCKICSFEKQTEIKGSTKATSNFVTHLKVKLFLSTQLSLHVSLIKF